MTDERLSESIKNLLISMKRIFISFSLDNSFLIRHIRMRWGNLFVYCPRYFAIGADKSAVYDAKMKFEAQDKTDF